MKEVRSSIGSVVLHHPPHDRLHYEFEPHHTLINLGLTLQHRPERKRHYERRNPLNKNVIVLYHLQLLIAS